MFKHRFKKELDNLKNTTHPHFKLSEEDLETIEMKFLKLDKLVTELSNILPYNIDLEIDSKKQKKDFKKIGKILLGDNQDKKEEAIKLFKTYPHSGEKVDMFIRFFESFNNNKD